MESVTTRQPFGIIVVIKRDGTDGGRFELVTQSCLFGREEGCDVRIQLPSVRPQHCRIEVDLADEKLYIVHLAGDESPTQLNGAVLHARTGLSHKDIFTIGDRSFRCEIPDYVSTIHAAKYPVKAELIEAMKSPARVAGAAIEAPKSPSRVAPQSPSRAAPKSPSRAAPSQSPARVPPKSPSRAASQSPARTANNSTAFSYNSAARILAEEPLTRSPIRPAASPARSPARIGTKNAVNDRVGSLLSAGISPSSFFARKGTDFESAKKSAFGGDANASVAGPKTPADTRTPARSASTPKISASRLVTPSASATKLTSFVKTTTSVVKVSSVTYSPSRMDAKKTPNDKKIKTPVSVSTGRVPNAKASKVTPSRTTSVSRRSASANVGVGQQSAKKDTGVSGDQVDEIGQSKRKSLGEKTASRKSLTKAVVERSEVMEVESPKKSRVQSPSPDSNNTKSQSAKKIPKGRASSTKKSGLSVSSPVRDEVLSPSVEKGKGKSPLKTPKNKKVQSPSMDVSVGTSSSKKSNNLLSSGSRLRKDQSGSPVVGSRSSTSKTGMKKSQSMNLSDAVSAMEVSIESSATPKSRKKPKLSNNSPNVNMVRSRNSSVLAASPPSVSLSVNKTISPGKKNDSVSEARRSRATERRSAASVKQASNKKNAIKNVTESVGFGSASGSKRTKSLTTIEQLSSTSVRSPQYKRGNRSTSLNESSKSGSVKSGSLIKEAKRKSSAADLKMSSLDDNDSLSGGDFFDDESSPEETWSSMVSTLGIKLTPAQKTYANHARRSREASSSAKKDRAQSVGGSRTSGVTPGLKKSASKEVKSDRKSVSKPTVAGPSNPLARRSIARSSVSSVASTPESPMDISLNQTAGNDSLTSVRPNKSSVGLNKSGSKMQSINRSKALNRRSSSAGSPLFTQSFNESVKSPQNSYSLNKLANPTSSGSKKKSGSLTASLESKKSKSSSGKKSQSGLDLSYPISSVTSSSDSPSLSKETKREKLDKQFMSSTPHLIGSRSSMSILTRIESNGPDKYELFSPVENVTKSAGRRNFVIGDIQMVALNADQLTRPPLRGSSLSNLPTTSDVTLSTPKGFNDDSRRSVTDTPSSSDSSFTIKSTTKQQLEKSLSPQVQSDNVRRGRSTGNYVKIPVENLSKSAKTSSLKKSMSRNSKTDTSLLKSANKSKSGTLERKSSPASSSSVFPSSQNDLFGNDSPNTAVKARGGKRSMARASLESLSSSPAAAISGNSVDGTTSFTEKRTSVTSTLLIKWKSNDSFPQTPSSKILTATTTPLGSISKELANDRSSFVARAMDSLSTTPGYTLSELASPSLQSSHSRRTKDERRTMPSVTQMKSIFSDIRRRSTSLPEQREPREEVNVSTASIRNSSTASSPRGTKRPGSPIKIGPPRSKRNVSFGPDMSPELFDHMLPPSTPLKRGAATTPSRRSVGDFGGSPMPPKSLLKKKLTSSALSIVEETGPGATVENQYHVQKLQSKKFLKVPILESPSGERVTPSGKKGTPASKSVSSSEKSVTPAGKHATPSGISKTPPGKSASPEKSVTPAGKGITPAGKSASPQKSVTPAGKSITPAGKSASPEKSETHARKSITPTGKSISPEKSVTSVRMSVSPEKSVTPAGKSATPKNVTPGNGATFNEKSASRRKNLSPEKSVTSVKKSVSPEKSVTPSNKNASPEKSASRKSVSLERNVSPSEKRTPGDKSVALEKNVTPSVKNATPSGKSVTSSRKSIVSEKSATTSSGKSETPSKSVTPKSSPFPILPSSNTKKTPKSTKGKSGKSETPSRSVTPKSSPLAVLPSSNTKKTPKSAEGKRSSPRSSTSTSPLVAVVSSKASPRSAKGKLSPKSPLLISPLGVEASGSKMNSSKRTGSSKKQIVTSLLGGELTSTRKRSSVVDLSLISSEQKVRTSINRNNLSISMTSPSLNSANTLATKRVGMQSPDPYTFESSPESASRGNLGKSFVPLTPLAQVSFSPRYSTGRISKKSSISSPRASRGLSMNDLSVETSLNVSPSLRIRSPIVASPSVTSPAKSGRLESPKSVKVQRSTVSSPNLYCNELLNSSLERTAGVSKNSPRSSSSSPQRYPKVISGSPQRTPTINSPRSKTSSPSVAERRSVNNTSSADSSPGRALTPQSEKRVTTSPVSKKQLSAKKLNTSSKSPNRLSPTGKRSWDSEPRGRVSSRSVQKPVRWSPEFNKSTQRVNTTTGVKMVSERNVDLSTIPATPPSKFYSNKKTVEVEPSPHVRGLLHNAVAVRAIYGKAALTPLAVLNASRRRDLESTVVGETSVVSQVMEDLNRSVSSTSPKKVQDLKTHSGKKLSSRKSVGVSGAEGKSVKQLASGRKRLWSEVVKSSSATGEVVVKKIVAQKIVKKKKGSVLKTPKEMRNRKSGSHHVDSPVTLVIGRAKKLTSGSPLNQKTRRSSSSTSQSLSDSVYSALPSTPDGPGEMLVSPMTNKSSSSRRSKSTPAAVSAKRRRLDNDAAFVSLDDTLNLTGVQTMEELPEDLSIVIGSRGDRQVAQTNSPSKGGQREKSKSAKSPKLSGIRALVKTPKVHKSPRLAGIKELVKTPSSQESPRLGGLKELVRTPKVQKSPKLRGVRELVKTPKLVKSAKVRTIRQLVKTPKIQKTPDLSGLKRLMERRKSEMSPQFEGVGELMKTPKSQKKKLNLTQVEVVDDLVCTVDLTNKEGPVRTSVVVKDVQSPRPKVNRMNQLQLVLTPVQRKSAVKKSKTPVVVNTVNDDANEKQVSASIKSKRQGKDKTQSHVKIASTSKKVAAVVQKQQPVKPSRAKKLKLDDDIVDAGKSSVDLRDVSIDSRPVSIGGPHHTPKATRGRQNKLVNVSIKGKKSNKVVPSPKPGRGRRGIAQTDVEEIIVSLKPESEKPKKIVPEPKSSKVRHGVTSMDVNETAVSVESVATPLPPARGRRGQKIVPETVTASHAKTAKNTKFTKQTITTKDSVNEVVSPMNKKPVTPVVVVSTTTVKLTGHSKRMTVAQESENKKGVQTNIEAVEDLSKKSEKGRKKVVRAASPAVEAKQKNVVEDQPIAVTATKQTKTKKGKMVISEPETEIIVFSPKQTRKGKKVNSYLEPAVVVAVPSKSRKASKISGIENDNVISSPKVTRGGRKNASKKASPLSKDINDQNAQTIGSSMDVLESHVAPLSAKITKKNNSQATATPAKILSSKVLPKSPKGRRAKAQLTEAKPSSPNKSVEQVPEGKTTRRGKTDLERPVISNATHAKNSKVTSEVFKHSITPVASPIKGRRGVKVQALTVSPQVQQSRKRKVADVTTIDEVIPSKVARRAIEASSSDDIIPLPRGRNSKRTATVGTASANEIPNVSQVNVSKSTKVAVVKNAKSGAKVKAVAKPATVLKVDTNVKAKAVKTTKAITLASANTLPSPPKRKTRSAK